MDRDLVVTVDVGTTALKVAIWDPEVAQPLATHIEEYTLSTEGRAVECDANVYLDAMTRGVSRVIANGLAGRVLAITIVTQGETLVLVDEANTPLGPAIVWLDTRADEEAKELRDRLQHTEFRRVTGLPALTGGTPVAKLHHLGRQTDQVVPAGGAILLLEDFLVAQLSGRRVSNPSIQSSTGWFDIRIDDYWDDGLRAVGLRREQLPALGPSGSVIGAMLPAWTERLGLPDGVAVVSGGMDQCAAALGAGAVESGVASVTFGSALAVVATVDSAPTTSSSSLTIYRHVIPRRWLVLEFLPTGAILFAWLRRLLSGSGGDIDYQQLDALARTVPIGSDGVVALPQFEGDTAGAGDTSTSGGFLGLTLATTAGHLVRSLMESTAFVLGDALCELDRHGVEVSRVLSSGGGSRSTTWQQIVSDACRVELHRLQVEEATSRGAALLAHWGMGTVPFGVDPTPPAAEVVAPTRHHADAYGLAQRRYRAALDAARSFWGADGRVSAAPAAPTIDDRRAD